SKPLPDFDNPPVTEMAMGLQFKPLQQLRSVQMGLLAQKYREKGLGVIEEHPRLAPIQPELPSVSASRSPLHAEWESRIQLPRIWFMNEPKTTLVQVQPDRF